jgi:hypothetical protein
MAIIYGGPPNFQYRAEDATPKPGARLIFRCTDGGCTLLGLYDNHDAILDRFTCCMVFGTSVIETLEFDAHEEWEFDRADREADAAHHDALAEGRRREADAYDRSDHIRKMRQEAAE